MEWIREVIRFHLDEHVPNSVAHGLRLRGIEVSTTVDVGLQGAEDLEHIGGCVRLFTGPGIAAQNSTYTSRYRQMKRLRFRGWL